MISGFGGAGALAGVTRNERPAPSREAGRALSAARAPADDDEQLIGFLRNITRADAAEVLALTRPSKGETQQTAGHVEAAYSEF